MCDDAPTPGSRSGRWVAAAPAAHSPSRRVTPKQPPGQIEQGTERPVGLSFLDDLLGQLVTNVADTAEAQPHLKSFVLQRGVREAGVDIGAMHSDAVPPGIGHQRLR